MTSTRPTKRIYITLALACILILSLWANLENNGFPLGYHPDETKKVNAIIDGKYRFKQPVLMIQVSRFRNLFAQHTSEQEVVEQGRAITALFGTGIVFATFCLFRFVAGPVPAVLTALGVAASPTIVVHSHYLKEDPYLTFFVLLALLSLLCYLKSPRRDLVIALGIATGLALSSKYVAATLFLFYFLVPLIYPVENTRVYFANIFKVVAISFTVFLAVNYPLFLDASTFLSDMKFELYHPFRGHRVSVYPLQFLFMFHFVYSIVPDVTPVMAFAGLAGIVLSRSNIFSLTGPEKVLLLFAVLYYFIVEVSPMKPFPDFKRYMMPIVPTVLYFAVRAVFNLVRLVGARGQAAPAALFGVCMIWPVHDSFMYVRNMEIDTRAMLQSQLDQLPAPRRVLSERYADPASAVHSAAIGMDRMRKLRLTHLVVSSFTYERYAFSKKLWWQDDKVYVQARRYDALFTCPYVEIRPAFRSFAFSNPTIRIVDIFRCPIELYYP